MIHIFSRLCKAIPLWEDWCASLRLALVTGLRLDLPVGAALRFVPTFQIQHVSDERFRFEREVSLGRVLQHFPQERPTFLLSVFCGRFTFIVLLDMKPGLDEPLFGGRIMQECFKWINGSTAAFTQHRAIDFVKAHAFVMRASAKGKMIPLDTEVWLVEIWL